ncbi:MAG: type VI secretion system tip protein TssI/VgrG [Polyangiaceae bacterium]
MDTSTTVTARLESSDFEATGLEIIALRGRERISELFWFDIDVVAHGTLPLPDEASPGAQLSLVLSQTLASGVVARSIHGVIERVCDRLDRMNDHRAYTLRLVPSLATLRLVETQEVFLNQTVPAILAAKLQLHGLAGDRLTMNAAGYPSRELVVQYKESDLAFVSRLAEHLGISFVFAHEEAAPEKLIFTDDVVDLGLPKSLLPSVEFQSRGDRSGVFALEVERALVPTSYMVQDYNYRTPLAEISGTFQLKKSDNTALGNGGGIVEYGTHHKDSAEGNGLAKVRAEERLSAYEVYRGKSVVMGLSAGLTTNLTGHPILGDKGLLVVEVTHAAEFAVSGRAPSYENQFTAIPSDVRYRPPRTTPRPRISGLVTGTIALGSSPASGGPAQIDAHGRYTVQLHFDTVTHTGEDKASHPVRMAQPFAGTSHGFHFPLRPGAEVVLSFLDGDPDRPIIVGSVPNTVAPSATTASNSSKNRVVTTAGVLFEIGEGK